MSGPLATDFIFVPLTAYSPPSVTAPLPSVVQRLARIWLPELTRPPSQGPAQCNASRPGQLSPLRIADATARSFGFVTDEAKR